MRNPLAIIASALGYQVTGWFSGKSVFDSWNADAKLFTALILLLGICGWFAWKEDEFTWFGSWNSRVVWLALITVGVVIGVILRLHGDS